ncbi:Tetratricopeptide repeat family, partial [Favolaschia claudopus]
MDPVSVTTTIITLATFIKDLVELGESIRSSIEKVGENRRQIRELSQDIVRTLYALESFTRGKEETLCDPELLGALENLKAEMLHVHSKCMKISSVQLPGLRGFRSQLTAWRKRDDLEKKIASLKERVSKCFSEFTASRLFIAHSTLRIEQRLVADGIESQATARRLEGMMTQLLLESDFGRHKLERTVEIISSDPTFQSLESQYMSAQLTSLITSVQILLASGSLFFELPSEQILDRPVLVDPTILTPSHALIEILQLTVKIDGMANLTVPLWWLRNVFTSLRIQLSQIGMHSEAVVWSRLQITCLRYASTTDYGMRALPEIASALCDASFIHSHQYDLASAVEFSQQSVDLWARSAEILPCDDHIARLRSMIVHADNLLQSDKKTAALRTAEDAISIARPIASGLIESISQVSLLTDEDAFDAAQSRDAFLLLARVFSSLDRHLDSYAAFMEGFQAALRLPTPVAPPCGYNIDSFIDVICKLAEGDHLSLPMLAECIKLFRDLTRIYRKSFSNQFLRLLHAFVYVSQQSAPALSGIRRFLEPRSDSSAPELDIAKPVLNDLDIVWDAVWLFYTEAPETSTVPLIKNILVVHFDRAIAVLKALQQSSAFSMIGFTWFLFIACEILPLIAKADYSSLLEVLGETIKDFLTSFVALQSGVSFGEFLQRICQHAARIGAHREALELCEHVAEYLACHFHTGDDLMSWSHSFVLLRIAIFCDAARFAEATELVQRLELESFSSPENLTVLRTRILLRRGRHFEALQVIKRAITASITNYWTHGPTFDMSLYFLFTQLAVVWGRLGHPHKALEAAEKAVEFCEKVEIECTDEEDGEYRDGNMVSLRIHSFTTLSNCQAAAGKSVEAFESAQKAVSLYMQNEHWETQREKFWILRRQESGANAFLTLSQQFAASGDHQRALSYAVKAIALFRELVALAPRHLPTLASGLQHLASIKWDLGRREEATVAREEAIQILRNVARSETYFLPTFADALDRHRALLLEQGDASGAAAVMSETVDARRKFASVPQGPEWSFEKV